MPTGRNTIHFLSSVIVSSVDTFNIFFLCVWLVILFLLHNKFEVVFNCKHVWKKNSDY